MAWPAHGQAIFLCSRQRGMAIVQHHCHIREHHPSRRRPVRLECTGTAIQRHRRTLTLRPVKRIHAGKKKPGKPGQKTVAARDIAHAASPLRSYTRLDVIASRQRFQQVLMNLRARQRAGARCSLRFKLRKLTGYRAVCNRICVHLGTCQCADGHGSRVSERHVSRDRLHRTRLRRTHHQCSSAESSKNNSNLGHDDSPKD